VESTPQPVRAKHDFPARRERLLDEGSNVAVDGQPEDLNPVRCHAVAFAGDCEWSNHRATAGLQPAPAWLEIDWTLGQFGAGNRAGATEAYRRFVADARGASYNDPNFPRNFI
jgi:hypothetical protein